MFFETAGFCEEKVTS